MLAITKEDALEKLYFVSKSRIGSNIFIISKGEVFRAMEIKAQLAPMLSINHFLSTLVKVLVYTSSIFIKFKDSSTPNSTHVF